MTSLLAKVQQLLHRELFQQVPFNIAIIDRDYNVVEANRNFEEYFGDWKDRKCYETYKGNLEPCPGCMTKKTFQDGKVRVIDEQGIDRHGRITHYVVHIAPIMDEEGKIPYVIEMSTDVTETKRWQREYQILFERVPCYITVIDKDFRIIRANEKFRNTFGLPQGRHCYTVYKHRRSKCPNCPAELTLKDGKVHSAPQKGKTMDGETAHYILTTSALAKTNGERMHVVEIANDVTDLVELKDELRASHHFQESMIEDSHDGIIATDVVGEIVIFNPAARKILNFPLRKDLTAEKFQELMPQEFLSILKNKEGDCHLPETEIETLKGEKIPVRLNGVALKDRRKFLGTAVFLQDLRPIKQLESEKLEAERLAAVGQTVAGLAHSVKNILMGLEGGMYIVSSGLKREDHQRISEGWEILERNFEKTTTLVKDFLSFARGRIPKVRLLNPNSLVKEIADLYKDTISNMGINLVLDLAPKANKIPLDPDGIHTCLTNLVSNAIDACEMSEKDDKKITLRTMANKEEFVFEVEDNGVGIEYEVKQKVFTTFFTTKGGQGTGLGLLTTRRIVQEHGGKIEMESEPGKGSLFRMQFILNRLPKPVNEE